MAVIYKGIEVSETLCRLTQKLSIRSVGVYNGQDHKFSLPELDPSTSDLEQIRKKFEEEKQFLANIRCEYVVQAICQQTSVIPESVELDIIRTAVGDKNSTLSAIEHVIFDEGDGRETDTIYLGENRFFVLSTSRSTLMPCDILVPNTVPLKIGEREEFTIFRNGKEFQPMEFSGYSTPFVMYPLKRMTHKTTPDIYDIIDKDVRFGGGALTIPKTKSAEERFMSLINKIKIHIQGLGNKKLGQRVIFPDYDGLLAEAKSLGIGCYILNLLIETFERRTKGEYQLVQDDWKLVDDDWKLPDELKKKLEEEKIKKLKREHRELTNQFTTEMKKIHTRRVGLFFKAAGRVDNADYTYELEKKLEALADKGIGTHKWADAIRKEAIAQSKPGRWENLITAVKLVVAMVVIILALTIWLKTERGLDDFNFKVEQADRMAKDKKYLDAKDLYNQAYENYRPRITSLLVSGTYNNRMKDLQQAIEAEISQGVEDINILLKADGGKFTSHTLEMLEDLFELDPRHKDLIELRDIYVNQ